MNLILASRPSHNSQRNTYSYNFIEKVGRFDMTRIVVLRPDEELRITGQKQSGSRPPQFYS
jgi:hypothetical protein